MWPTGMYWSMEEGVKCVVELTNEGKSVVVLVKSDNETPENFTDIFTQIIGCVKDAKADFCHLIEPELFLLDSTDEADYFNDDHMYKMSDVERILACPERKEVIHSVSENREMKVPKLREIFNQVQKESIKQEQLATSSPESGKIHYYVDIM